MDEFNERAFTRGKVDGTRQGDPLPSNPNNAEGLPKKTIEEFLLDRVADYKKLINATVTADMLRKELVLMIEHLELIIDWHKNWPILVETKPTFEPTMHDDYDAGAFINQATFRVSQQIAWTTQEEYRRRFGSAPPTAPLLRQIANRYSYHEDFDPAWEI